MGGYPTCPVADVAEYSEPPVVQDNVSDTGPSLRAFLPVGAQERQLLRNYTGKAFVLDSRVTCQKPVITEFTVNALDHLYFKGRVSPTTSTPRLDVPEAVQFNCIGEWDRWTICELSGDALWSGFTSGATGTPSRQPHEYPITPQNFSGGLVSEFREFPLSPGQNKSGAAFLLTFVEAVVHPTTGAEFTTWQEEYGSIEWTYHATMCYTSLDFADRWIVAHGDTNRTEPTMNWSGGGYDITSVAAQLDSGYAPSSPPPSAERRGIMWIQGPANWSAPQSSQPPNDGPIDIVPSAMQGPTALPWFTYHLHMNTVDSGVGNNTIILSVCGDTYTTGYKYNPLQVSYYYSDAWLCTLFGELMEKRSSSVALQAVITSLAGIDYYKYVGQFDKSDDVSMVSFINVNTPGGPLGTRRTDTPRGLTLVVVLIAIHTTLVAVVAVRFWRQTTSSRIGDDWQAIAQVALSDIGILNDGLRAATMPGAERDIVGKLGGKSVVASRVYLAEEKECRTLKVKQS